MTLAAQVNQTLVAAMETALKHHAGSLLERGTPLAEANASLDLYRADLEAWRTEALSKIERIIDEPAAPSHVLQ
jgi:hypothetical protein